MERARLKMYVIGCHVDKPLGEKALESAFDCMIQAGAANTDLRIYELNDHDDFEGSISDRNYRYSECTAMYWIGKHISSDYVGITHYRRRFDLTDEELMKHINAGVDIITTNLIDLGKSIRQDYCDVLYAMDWELFMELIKGFHEEDYELAKNVFESNWIHPCNLHVFRADLYEHFCEWAFPIMDAFYKRSPVKTDRYQRRDVGFIGERLSHLFVMKMAKEGKKIVEARLNELKSNDWKVQDECNLSNPMEVYEACERLYAEGKITQCQNVLGAAMKTEASNNDIIKGLSELFATGIMERRSGQLTMHEYLPVEWRKDLNTLINSYNALQMSVDLLSKNANAESIGIFKEYIKNTNFSNVAVLRQCQQLGIGEEMTGNILALRGSCFK